MGVVGLEFWEENDMQGLLPSCLGSAFPFLERLVIANNKGVSGTLPRVLGQQGSDPRLEMVALVNNSIGGELPSKWDSTKLKVLRVEGNRLSGTLPDLTQLKALRWLTFDRNFISGEVSDSLFSSALPNLTHVSGSVNFLSGTVPDTLAAPSLEMLSLSNNYITGSLPRGLSERLHTLAVFGNQITGTVPSTWGTALRSGTSRLRRTLLSLNFLSCSPGGLPHHSDQVFALAGNMLDMCPLEAPVKDDPFYTASPCHASSFSRALFRTSNRALLTAGLLVFALWLLAVAATRGPSYHRLYVQPNNAVVPWMTHVNMFFGSSGRFGDLDKPAQDLISILNASLTWLAPTFAVAAAIYLPVVYDMTTLYDCNGDDDPLVRYSVAALPIHPDDWALAGLLIVYLLSLLLPVWWAKAGHLCRKRNPYARLDGLSLSHDLHVRNSPALLEQQKKKRKKRRQQQRREAAAQGAPPQEQRRYGAVDRFDGQDDFSESDDEYEYEPLDCCDLIRVALRQLLSLLCWVVLVALTMAPSLWFALAQSVPADNVLDVQGSERYTVAIVVAALNAWIVASHLPFYINIISYVARSEPRARSFAPLWVWSMGVLAVFPLLAVTLVDLACMQGFVAFWPDYEHVTVPIVGPRSPASDEWEEEPLFGNWHPSLAGNIMLGRCSRRMIFLLSSLWCLEIVFLCLFATLQQLWVKFPSWLLVVLPTPSNVVDFDRVAALHASAIAIVAWGGPFAPLLFVLGPLFLVLHWLAVRYRLHFGYVPVPNELAEVEDQADAEDPDYVKVVPQVVAVTPSRAILSNWIVVACVAATWICWVVFSTDVSSGAIKLVWGSIFVPIVACLFALINALCCNTPIVV